MAESHIAPSYVQVAPSSPHSGPPLQQRGMGLGAVRGAVAYAAGQRRGARRRLLKAGQSNTILVEKACMRELYKSKLIQATD